MSKIHNSRDWHILNFYLMRNYYSNKYCFYYDLEDEMLELIHVTLTKERQKYLIKEQEFSDKEIVPMLKLLEKIFEKYKK